MLYIHISKYMLFVHTQVCMYARTLLICRVVRLPACLPARLIVILLGDMRARAHTHRPRAAWVRVWRPTRWPRYRTSFSSFSRARASSRTPRGRRHPYPSPPAHPRPLRAEAVREVGTGGGRRSTHPRRTGPRRMKEWGG